MTQNRWAVWMVLGVFAAACGSGGGAATGGSSSDVAAAADASADVAAADSTALADTGAAPKPDSAVADGPAPKDAPPADTPAPAELPTQSDAPPPQDSALPPDVFSPPDVAPPSDTGCPPCKLNCICKKGFDGCPLNECEPTTCVELVSKIDALKSKVTACTADKGCQPFEYPICDSAGCFQLGVGAGNDLTELQDLAGKAGAAQCSGFHCGCAPAPPTYCLKNQCRSCPPDCDGTCDELKAAILSTAKQMASFCGTDADCTVVSTAMCPLGDLPCGGVPANKYSKPDALLALISAYSAPCGAAMCKCAAPGPAKCVKGQCVIQK